ncbi:hypothetical protein [Octadecabacter ascidiaceicola]|uniref:Uncharacterized protein n=1 Tax=Octadecabacter ascidiaceicola TaxID=1655543 RepID=A0A238JMY7_9RHOB|nr:hypothetical protein [Octadecabacter ascidiaceicola]SMX31574.1 hypothetical protein OCA8868_00430 [Octadecabacter ascidiaceicola]
MDPEERCDPELFSCITTDEIQFALPFIFVALGAFLVWRLIRSEVRKINGHQKRRGTAHGHGDTVKSVFIPSDSSRGFGKIITVRHTKDPQKHAQAMMPAKARNKDETK